MVIVSGPQQARRHFKHCWLVIKHQLKVQQKKTSGSSETWSCCKAPASYRKYHIYVASPFPFLLSKSHNLCKCCLCKQTTGVKFSQGENQIAFSSMKFRMQKTTSIWKVQQSTNISLHEPQFPCFLNTIEVANISYVAGIQRKRQAKARPGSPPAEWFSFKSWSALKTLRGNRRPSLDAFTKHTLIVNLLRSSSLQVNTPPLDYSLIHMNDVI